ncbi:MAG: FtsX-like permease family protein [Acidobacteriota bacterium]
MSGLVLFYRLILRPLFRQPGRALLILFAVALGDAAVVAIDLAGNAAAGSFHSSIETLAGKSDFEVTAAGGVPEAVVARLARLSYALQISPRIEDHAMVAETGQAVPLIGIDMVGAANGANLSAIGPTQVSEGIRHINDPDAIWITSGLAKSVGARIPLLIDDHTKTYIVRGILPGAEQVSGDAILMDIGAAQAATGKQGRLDRILIRTPAQGDFATWQSRLRAALPAGVLLNARGAETAANRRMLAAFRWNLLILSYIALVVGAFLIYSALSVSVVRRRPDIGTMRALGASRSAVLMAFLAEAAAFGTLGSLLALPLGRVLAAGAVRMLSTTVNALYVSSRPGPMSITAGSAALALIVGISVSCISALAPAREASMVPPTEAMARGRREYDVGVERKRDALIALGLALCGAAAAQAPEIGGKPMMGYLAALLFVAAAALLTPLVVHSAMSAGAEFLRRLIGMEGLLASRSLSGSLRRTSVLVAALATAVAMMTSVGIMVGSFRETVLTWMRTELPADLYLRPAGWTGGDQHPTMSPEIAERIARVPGVAVVRRLRAYDIQYQGLPATLAGADPNPAGWRQSPLFLSGTRGADVLGELTSGNFAVVSEPFANKHHIKTGMSITLPLGEQRVSFRILGIFYDYGDEAGLILVDWHTLLRYLPDPAPSNLAVYLAPGASLEQTRVAVQKAIGNSDVLVFSNREIRRQGIRVFDQTFAITYALEAISILVAVGGIAGALASIVMDRRREFGVLRFLGATARQIRALILVEAGLIGIVASAMGLALGIVLSLVLVFVINKQSFGWTIQFHWPVAVLLSSMAIVYVATVLAGLYPASLAVRTSPIEVIHEE